MKKIFVLSCVFTLVLFVAACSPAAPSSPAVKIEPTLPPSPAANPTLTPVPSAVVISGTTGVHPLELAWAIGGEPYKLVQPNAVAVDKLGNIYLGEGDNPGNRVWVFDNDGKYLKKWGGESGAADGQFDSMTGLAVDGQGNVYVSDFQNTRIQKFDNDGKFLMKIATEPPVGPTGVVVDQQGNIYVQNHRAHAHVVQKFDSTGHLLLSWGAAGEGDGQFSSMGGADGIAIDRQGNLYVADTSNCRMQKFDPGGTFLAKYGSCGAADGQFNFGPRGIVVDGSGSIYATSGNSLQKFDSAGRFLEKWILPGNSRAVAVDQQGSIYMETGEAEFLRKFRQH